MEGASLTSEPEIHVYVSFESGPLNTSPVWVDITEYVQEFYPTRGRDNEIGDVEAGTMSLVLDNTDGRFTPKRVASPYYPNIKPRRAIQVFAVHEGVTYSLFKGMVERWPATTEYGSTSMTVPCVDAMTLIARASLSNPYISELGKHDLDELYVMNDNSTSFYYGQNDPSNNRLHALPALTNNLAIRDGNAGPPQVTPLSKDIQPNGAGIASVQVRNTYDVVVNGTTAQTGVPIFSDNWFDHMHTTTDNPGWMVSFFYRYVPAENNPAEEAMVCRLETENNRFPLLELHAGHAEGRIYYTLYYRGPELEDQFGDPLGEPEYVAVFSTDVDLATNPLTSEAGDHISIGFHPDIANNGTMTQGVGLFVNGAGSYQSMQSNSMGLDSTDRVRLMFGSNYYPPPPGPLAGSGTYNVLSHDYDLAMVSVHRKPFTLQDTVDLLTAGGGFAGQSIWHRLNYVLDQINWPISWRNLESHQSDSRLAAIRWENELNALTELQAPARDSNGLLFVNGQGNVDYQSRFQRVNPEPDTVLDPLAGTGVESGLNFDMSDDDIVNVIEIENANGLKVKVRNEDSVTEYGEAIKTASVRLESNEEALQYGQWAVNRFGEAQLRIDGISINPSAHATGGLWDAVLNLELSSVIELANLPDNAPDSDLRYFVEKITHNVARVGDRLHWITDLQVSPAINRQGWRLGDPTYGVLGQTTVLHY